VLASFGTFDSPLGYHPDRRLVPGVEISSGSLGHGLGIAVGVALALRRAVPRPRVVCLLGDAELDEGSNHEAIALGGRFALDGLTAVVIDNDSSSYGWPGGVEERFAGEGWASRRLAAHDHEALAAALSWRPPADTPNVVVVEAVPKQNTWRSLQFATTGPVGGARNAH